MRLRSRLCRLELAKLRKASPSETRCRFGVMEISLEPRFPTLGWNFELPMVAQQANDPIERNEWPFMQFDELVSRSGGQKCVD